MDAVVMAGGLGTRLLPLTTSIPKPLLPLGDRTILDVVLEQLSAQGARRVFLCIGHLASMLKAHVGTGEKWNVDIRYLEEPEPQGTAGGLRELAGLDDDFLLINGDTLTDLDFRDLLRFHKAEGAAATLFTPWIEHRVPYGVVTFDPETGQLAAYEEKPKHGFFVSAGVYALSPRLLRLLPAAGRVEMPELIQSALRAGERVLCYRSPAYWRDIGLTPHYERAIADFKSAPGKFLK